MAQRISLLSTSNKTASQLTHIMATCDLVSIYLRWPSETFSEICACVYSPNYWCFCRIRRHNGTIWFQTHMFHDNSRFGRFQQSHIFPYRYVCNWILFTKNSSHVSWLVTKFGTILVFRLSHRWHQLKKQFDFEMIKLTQVQNRINAKPEACETFKPIFFRTEQV